MTRQKVVLVINPNTCEAMTKSIHEAARSVCSGFQVITRQAEIGPESIEGPLDRALAIPGIVATALNEESKFDAIVSACFGDPGIEVLQSIFDIPVLGILESSLFIASRGARNFSILTAGSDSIPFLSKLIHEKGFGEKLRSLRAADLTVLETEEDNDRVRAKILNSARDLASDGANSIIMGCAGLGKYSELIYQQTGLISIDPVKAGVQMAGVAINYWRETNVTQLPETHRKALQGYPLLERLYQTRA